MSPASPPKSARTTCGKMPRNRTFTRRVFTYLWLDRRGSNETARILTAINEKNRAEYVGFAGFI